ncbi:MAG: PspC domain-containing protein [Gammaproteobacteria bacterium]|nr:PspC domain-containing protein [Gammaproteobacteria bacterium]MDH3375218.1 PspC domain-containing protein [Gammaproteobacteria bacterium]MDH3410053.1 PspC domain-containing protein [Gammaproteobacteria bacterium]MDH3551826.1 PspC domain-containing protein [Gammaproteobacteria bacterium]
MTAQATMSRQRFVRNADKALLAGVCAGIADYFGFNLRVTRLLVIIAFFVAMPITLITYFAIVFLVPAESNRHGYTTGPCCGPRRRRRMSRREIREAAEESHRQAADSVRQRAQSLDERLARIEKYVTSSRYALDREFRKL